MGDGSNVRDLVKGALAAEVFSFLEKAGSIAHSMNTRVYVVGGFVRDLFLRTQPGTCHHTAPQPIPSTLSHLKLWAQDIDLVVEGDGLTFADKLAKVLHLNEPKDGASVVYTTLVHLHDCLNQATEGQVKHHHKFSSALVKLPSGVSIDVATARLEYYPSPAALPCVELSSLKMNLYRRDFTINAMVLASLPFGPFRSSFLRHELRCVRRVRVGNRADQGPIGHTRRLLWRHQRPTPEGGARAAFSQVRAHQLIGGSS